MDKQTLRQYRNLVKEIELLTTERNEVIETVVGAVSIDGLPKGNSISDMTADAAAKAMELSNKIDKAILRMVEVRTEIEDALSLLAEAEDRLLMRYRYIEGYRWETIADLMHYDRSTVLRKHGWILQQLRCCD